jgi:hypothetical protein
MVGPSEFYDSLFQFLPLVSSFTIGNWIRLSIISSKSISLLFYPLFVTAQIPPKTVLREDIGDLTQANGADCQ